MSSTFPTAPTGGSLKLRGTQGLRTGAGRESCPACQIAHHARQISESVVERAPPELLSRDAGGHLCGHGQADRPRAGHRARVRKQDQCAGACHPARPNGQERGDLSLQDRRTGPECAQRSVQPDRRVPQRSPRRATIPAPGATRWEMLPSRRGRLPLATSPVRAGTTSQDLASAQCALRIGVALRGLAHRRRRTRSGGRWRRWADHRAGVGMVAGFRGARLRFEPPQVVR